MEETRYTTPDAYVMAELRDAHQQLEHKTNHVNELLKKLNAADERIAELEHKLARITEVINPHVTRFGRSENHATINTDRLDVDRFRTPEEFDALLDLFGLTVPTYEETCAEFGIEPCTPAEEQQAIAGSECAEEPAQEGPQEANESEATE